MTDTLILAGYIVVVAGFYALAHRIFNRGELKIQEQKRHEHLHTLHQKKK